MVSEVKYLFSHSRKITIRRGKNQKSASLVQEPITLLLHSMEQYQQSILGSKTIIRNTKELDSIQRIIQDTKLSISWIKLLILVSRFIELALR